MSGAETPEPILILPVAPEIAVECLGPDGEYAF